MYSKINFYIDGDGIILYDAETTNKLVNELNELFNQRKKEANEKELEKVYISYKDKKRNTYFARFRVGNREITKRGFATKAEAQQFEYKAKFQEDNPDCHHTDDGCNMHYPRKF